MPWASFTIKYDHPADDFQFCSEQLSMGAKQGNTSNIFDRSLLSVPVPGLIFFITKFKEA